MRKIAITGNIASGKSAVEDILKAKGYKVLDSDIVGHEVLEKSEEVREVFKNYDIFENKTISREKLGKIVFADKTLLKKLEDILHPQIKEKINEFFKQNSGEKAVFVSIPLLFETNMQDMFDEILLVAADENIRLNRVMARNGYSKEYALKRIKSQMPQDEKLARVDFIIDNNTTVQELENQINTIF